MAIISKDSLSGELELVGRPTAIQWGKPADFLDLIKKVFRVRFPSEKNADFISTGPETPGPSEADRLWAKFDKNRNPGGWFAFIKGKWQRFYTVAPGEIRWFIGSSEEVPDGWQLINDEIQGLNAAVLAKIRAQYVESPPASGIFTYYAARYIGY